MVALISVAHAVAVEESEILRQLDGLRKIEPTKDRKELERLNQRMDAAWRFLEAHKAESAPVIRRELARELEQKRPDQFFILDGGKLLLSLQGPEAEPLALSALAKIEPEAEIIQYNFQELFEFTHEVAKLGSPKVLPQIDRLFLSNTRKLDFFSAPHRVTFDATDLCAVLYGVTGTNGEAYLSKILSEQPATRLRVLETLSWLGSERCVEPVKKVMATTGDYETLARSVSFLMTLGGPAGQTAVLNLDRANLDAKAKAFHDRILPDARRMSLKTMQSALKRLDDPDNGKALTDEQVKERLKKMYDNFGVDHETNPSSITTSGLSPEYLIDRLKEIRSRMFFRRNNHSLEDVKVTNFIINTVQYKR